MDPNETYPDSVEIPDTFKDPVSTVAVSTPTLVKFAPSPTKLVAVTTPVTLIPEVSTVTAEPT